MAGHSKWANIQHRKKAQDAKRGKLFTRLIKEIVVAAKAGGSDLDANPSLRAAVDKAKSQSVPAARVSSTAPITRKFVTRVTVRQASRFSSTACPTTAIAPSPMCAMPSARRVEISVRAARWLTCFPVSVCWSIHPRRMRTTPGLAYT